MGHENNKMVSKLTIFFLSAAAVVAIAGMVHLILGHVASDSI
jgi:hypothetical protein